VRNQHVQALGGQLAGAAHALEVFRLVDLDLAGAGFGFDLEGGVQGHALLGARRRAGRRSNL